MLGKLFAAQPLHQLMQGPKKRGKVAAPAAVQLAPSLLADVPLPAAADGAPEAALQAEIALTTELLMQARRVLRHTCSAQGCTGRAVRRCGGTGLQQPQSRPTSGKPARVLIPLLPVQMKQAVSWTYM